MSRPRSPSKALVSSSSKPNQLIVPPPLESVTPSHSLEMINRYQTLGTIHRPDYSSALASDPFASSQSVSVTPFPVNPIKPSRSEYTNSHVTNLFYKESSHPKTQTINEIAKFHFGSGCHFTLSHPEKTLSYYKDILLNHHSILIKPIQDRTYAYKILYHSIYIHNIVSMAEWGNPNQLHILPDDLSNIIHYFASVYPFSTHQRQFPLLLIFIAKYKISWIFKWHYGIDDNIIIRQHTVKWWVKFNVPRILEIVQEEFPPDQHTPTPALAKAQQNPTADPVIGGSLLLTYTTGYVAPLLLAASFAGALQSLLLGFVNGFLVWELTNLWGLQVFVRKVIELHDKYMAYVNNCFMNHTLFHKALKEAFEVFCNKGVGGSSSAELLATFCDNILKKGGSEKLSDEAIEETLEKVVKLLAYISDKDLFAEFYRKKLARRLLFDKSANDEHERSILTKLKQQCGGQFTSKMEGMVTDLTLARENQTNFEKYLKTNPDASLRIDLTVTVLTTGFWPSYKSFDLNLPAKMVKCVEVFREFYQTKTKHRKLTWIYSLGTCNLNGKFELKTMELIVTTCQASVLLLFNASDRLSYQEIKTQLNLTDDDVVRLLHSLSCAKYKILNKEPNNKTISPTDPY
ncbi:uncharacterized protein LOC114280257 [Camellia sinensis]|nr:uncharacterized protein LOC114280257 [Camellia sinensis]